MKPKDLARVVVDTTVQAKAVMFPTDAKLLNRARERLVRIDERSSTPTCAASRLHRRIDDHARQVLRPRVGNWR